MKLNNEQQDVLIDWLEGRKEDITSEMEDLGTLKPLLGLLKTKVCDFCTKKGDWRTILRDAVLKKKDGSDMILCNTCLNLYANHQYEELTERIEKLRKKRDGWYDCFGKRSLFKK